MQSSQSERCLNHSQYFRARKNTYGLNRLHLVLLVHCSILE